MTVCVDLSVMCLEIIFCAFRFDNLINSLYMNLVYKCVLHLAALLVQPNVNSSNWAPFGGQITMANPSKALSVCCSRFWNRRIQRKCGLAQQRSFISCLQTGLNGLHGKACAGP